MEWHDLYGAINAHRKDFDLSGDQARSLASQAWESLKGSAAAGRKEQGSGEELSVRLPVVPQRELGEAAGLDIARGVIDYLLEHASQPTSREVLESRARKVLESARGETSQADMEEHQIGYHVGEMLVLLAVDMGIDWSELQHRDMATIAAAPRVLPAGAPVPIDRRLPPGIGVPKGKQDEGTLSTLLRSPVAAEAVKLLGEFIK